MQHCCVCLGDLSRYSQLYICEGSNSGDDGASVGDAKARDFSVAARHYTQASQLLPGTGKPYNQLALLATYGVTTRGDQSQRFNAVYYYCRALAVEPRVLPNFKPRQGMAMRTF